jgi:hypothetical protein
MFGPKRDDVMGEWRKLLSGELHSLYSPPNIIRQMKSKRMKCSGLVACMGEKSIEVGKRLLGRSRHRWE